MIHQLDQNGKPGLGEAGFRLGETDQAIVGDESGDGRGRREDGKQERGQRVTFFTIFPKGNAHSDLWEILRRRVAMTPYRFSRQQLRIRTTSCRGALTSDTSRTMITTDRLGFPS